MADSRAQSTYQVRLCWGIDGLTQLAPADILVIVDAIETTGAVESTGVIENAETFESTDATDSTESIEASGAIVSSDDLAAQGARQPHRPTVFRASLRNATATARAVFEEQLARGGRTSVNLVLVGDEGRFAVEDYFVAGAIGDVLTALGLDHSSPDVAVATEGFRPLTRAVKHLFTASSAGQALKRAGRGDEVKAAAEHDVERVAIRVSGEH